MLLADGDKMGKALEILAPSGIQKHKHISQALEVFTQQCRDIVDNCGGSLIYAGGDDVLALLPLHTAFDCAQKLQESFLTAVKTCFSVEQQQFCPTLSVGVAICHHLQPMSETRELAKKAEKLAKIQRNSLGVVFAKRSGSAIEITERWDASHQNKTLIQRIWYWAELFQNNVIPYSTAFMMAEAIEPLVLNWDALSDQEKKSVSDSCRTLAAGVLQRRNIEGTDQEVRAHQEFLKSYFFKSENPATQIQKISIELQIAREMVHVVNEIETTYQKSSNEVQS